MTEIPNRTKLSPTEAAALVCGLLPTLLGGVVLAGWYLGNKTLIQVSPDFVPMQYNTALGFVVGGAGLLCTISSSRVAIRIFGAMAAAIGLLTLIQYVFGAELGIDQLFMEHYITVETSHPGRMAPNTALCFSLTGIALLIAGRAGETTWTWPAVAVLGSLVLGLGVVAFSGYAMRLETAYGWGNLTRMAVHTSAGFIVLGLGLFWHAWHKERASVADLPYWFPAPVGIVTLTITLSLWQALDREELASHLILAFGVLLSGAFAYTVRLAQGLRRRARELEREVEERIKAEQELEDGRADLERTVEARTQELEISQERFALSIRGSGDGIWEFDPGRRENWYSSRFEEMLGYAEGEIPNTLEASIELLHPEDREAANEGFIRHLKDDTPYDIEYRLRTKSGDYRWVRARAKSLRDANGRATRTSGSTTDIDEQKQAEERLLRNERQFVMILEAAPVGVTVTDSKSKRVVVNQRYADIVGIPRDELLGSSAANVWAREEDRAEYARRFAEDNRVVDMEF